MYIIIKSISLMTKYSLHFMGSIKNVLGCKVSQINTRGIYMFQNVWADARTDAGWSPYGSGEVKLWDKNWPEFVQVNRFR